MKRLLFIATAAACILAVSCKQEQIPSLTASGQEEIVFTASDSMTAEVSTKTPAVTTLESMGFNASATTGSSSETELWNNASFSYHSGLFTGDKYWPVEDNGIHFYASNSDITFNAGGCSVNGVSGKSRDVVCAYIASPLWNQPNELTFEHIFARLGNVTVTPPSGYTATSVNISFTPYISGNYNIKTKEWSNKETDSVSPLKTIASASGSNSGNDIWLVPGSYILTANYTLQKGSGGGAYSESFTKTAEVVLQAGKINSIQTTLPDGNATNISFSVTVTPWSNNNITAVFTTPEP